MRKMTKQEYMRQGFARGMWRIWETFGALYNRARAQYMNALYLQVGEYGTAPVPDPALDAMVETLKSLQDALEQIEPALVNAVLAAENAAPDMPRDSRLYGHEREQAFCALLDARYASAPGTHDITRPPAII